MDVMGFGLVYVCKRLSVLMFVKVLRVLSLIYEN
jgi:hypothetical protein